MADSRDDTSAGDAMIPANAQTLGNHYASLEASHNHLTDKLRSCDQPAVKALLLKHKRMLCKAMNECNSTFTRTYDELEPLHEKDFDAAGTDQPDGDADAGQLDEAAVDAMPEEEKRLVLSALGRMRTEVREMRRSTERLIGR
jgi:hypothetical protein